MRNVLLLLFVCLSLSIYAQNSPKCGYTQVRDGIISKYGIASWHEMQAAQSNTVPASKSTAGGADTIPLVFHIIVTQNQLNLLGKEAGIIKLIDSQLKVINADFNAMNKDSVLIPAPFKPLFGNAGIKFGLAHTAPDGSSTPGYEISITTLTGFNLEGGTGSGFGFSTAKYKSSGGADAWDPSTYLNIWVFNVLENNKSSNILGLTIPPSFTRGSNGLSPNELGVILSYKVGTGTPAFRTLTHELGHYFELRHTWGDDDGKCPDNGGMDDGIADTPPQSRETYGCPAFPKYDACSNKDPGIMFMNYMDYTDDPCQHLFTKEQANRMASNVLLNAPSYSLTQHETVLHFPVADIENDFIIYPNPAHTYVNIYFTKTSTALKAIRIINVMGQVVAQEILTQQKGFYNYNLSNSGKGIYFVHLQFEGRTEIKKIELQ
jgi:hypothetical protein